MKTDHLSAAALTTLGVVGFIAPASAGTVTITENIGFGTGYADIAIDSTTPQFSFQNQGQSADCGKYGCSLNWNETYLVTQNSGLIASTGAGGVNAILPNLDYAGGSADIGSNSSGKDVSNGSYVNLAFTNGAGQTEYGFAALDGSGGLASITYQPAAVASGVPEPSSWALLIAGFGAVGVVATRRRRQSAVLAA